jgi:hypothetical protein
MFIPFPANVEIYVKLLRSLVEFDSLKPDTILGLYEEGLTVASIMNGGANQARALQNRSVVDSLSLSLFLVAIALVVLAILLLLTIIARK